MPKHIHDPDLIAEKCTASLCKNLKPLCSILPFLLLANLENSAVATDWKRSAFIPIPKKGNAKECSNYCTTALISHTSKVMLKIL